MQLTINESGVNVNGKNWRDLSFGKRILYTVLIPIVVLLALIVAVFAVSIALGAVALVFPVVLVAVIFACIVALLAIAIWLPIAIFKKGGHKRL